MQKYELTLTGITDDYQASDLADYRDENTFLRVTLSGMHPDDSFYIEVPAEFASGSINELFEYVFPSKHDQQKERIRTLDVVEYPNLPNIYMYLVELLESEEKGGGVLDWSVNFGPVHVDPSTMVQEHCSLTYEEDSEESYKTLHLVLDEYEMPFKDYDDYKALHDDKKEFLGLYMHYVILNHSIETVPSSAIRGNIKEALDYCLNENLILLDESEDSDISISVTDQGIKKITELEEECQYYIDNYNIFASVYVEEGFIDFESEEGIDLRMAAMRYDGLNPYRANMVINLFAGVYDDHADSWQNEIQSEKFFARYLGGAAVRESELSAEEFEQVMLEGKQNIGAIE
jgi:hypothetical protein